MTRIVHGTIDPNGRRLSGTGFSVSRTEEGSYNIVFTPGFNSLPAVTGSQNGFNIISQNTLDNVVFPFVNADLATAFTGDSNGNKTDRQFAFIAVGE